MQSIKGFTRTQKRDVMIALLLLSCVLLAVLVGILLSFFVGTPVNLNGNIENIRVKITEVCTRNRSIICDSKGMYSDYIELYNGGETFNLQGFALTDSAYKEVKYVFDSREFVSGQYLVIFLNGTEVPFSLKSEGGETVYLLSPDGAECASITTIKTDSDMVLSLQKGSYVTTANASPGYPNTAEGRAAYKLGLSDGSNTLIINELLTENKSVLSDKSGNYSDIIEITNIAAFAVSTNGWYVSDSIGNPHRYALPDLVLQPGEFLIVFADGVGVYKDGEIHASFGLSEGETAVLSGPDGRFTTVDVATTEDNYSLCRNMDGGGNIVYTQMSPSLGFANNEDGMAAFAESKIDRDAALVISEMLLSVDELAYGGSLCDAIEITNVSSDTVSTLGWYLSDDLSNPYKFALPEFEIQKGESKVIIADSVNCVEGTDIHANFSLSQGETLHMITPEKRQGQPVSVVSAGRGRSWQYNKDGDESGYIAASPSLGFSNNDSGRAEYANSVRPQGIEISEAVSVNKQYLVGPYGAYHDFIELHNNTGNDISLSGMFLSDNIDNLNLAALPNVNIPAGGYIVFILSSDGINTPNGYTVLPFSLAAEGESVYLSKDGKITDCIVIPALSSDNSYGRANGSAAFSYLSSATPKEANSSAVAETAPKPTSSVNQGVYNDVNSLSVELNGKGTIRYTLDNTEPNATSPIYNGAIKISSTTVVRARCFENGYLPGEVLELLYVINEGIELDIVSIITNPDNLWDYYTGIYAEGPNAEAEFPHVGANYWQTWEKEATVSFFEKDGNGFSEPCGLRIFGAYSRALPMKSFCCFFRSQYGASELNYKLFKNSDLTTYEAFVLRNAGQDFNRARMRDAMITSLVADATSVAVQNYRPVVVYLNNEFWGVYYIREKLNENYVAGNYSVTEDSVVMARANGTYSDEYQELIKYVRSHDLSNEENYQYILSKIDKENYIDFICSEIYIANTDNGNIRFFKSSEMDGKWRWVMFDVDWSFSDYLHPTVSEHLNPEGTGSLNRFSTALINALLKNNSFKEEFIRRMAWQLQNIWTDEKVLTRINEIKTLIQHDMVRDHEKWTLTMSGWQNHINKLITFQQKRPAEIYKQIKSYFSLSDSQMADYGFSK